MTRGIRDEDSVCVDDADCSDEEDTEELGLYVDAGQGRLTKAQIALLATRMVRDHSRAGSAQVFAYEIERLVGAGVLRRWGRLALGARGDRIRAKDTESLLHQNGRDASHIEVRIFFFLSFKC